MSTVAESVRRFFAKFFANRGDRTAGKSFCRFCQGFRGKWVRNLSDSAALPFARRSVVIGEPLTVYETMKREAGRLIAVAIRAVIAKEIQLCKATPPMRRKATFYPVAGLIAG
jgi:hypothetical protein